MGDSLGQPLQFSGLSFVIVSSLEVVFFVVLPKRTKGRGMSGLSFELEGFGACACTASPGPGMLVLSFLARGFGLARLG